MREREKRDASSFAEKQMTYLNRLNLLFSDDLSDLVRACGGSMITSLSQFTSELDVIRIVMIDSDDPKLLPQLYSK